MQYEKRQFGTTQSEIEHLAGWLQQQQVSEVVMRLRTQAWSPRRNTGGLCGTDWRRISGWYSTPSCSTNQITFAMR
ncbi:MAG: hypothetical protein ACR2NN_25750 [Bryobacteraceae bacterium]